MTRSKRVWMTRRDYTRLHHELAALRTRRSMEVPDDFMDHNPNLIPCRSMRPARIRTIQDLLTNAVVSENLADDMIAKPGMVLTIRYEPTGETETFLLGRRGAEGADIKVYSMASPLGRAISGARPGEQRIYSIPNESGRIVTLLDAVPYGLNVAKRKRPEGKRVVHSRTSPAGASVLTTSQ